MFDRRQRVARFGLFEADLVTGELRRDGVRVALQQQPFRVLAALLERRGDLVSRDELRHLLWPEGTHVAFERGLTSALRKVREALGDTAADARYIETLAGRGYRFVRPIDWANAPMPVTRRSRLTRPIVLRLAAALLVAAVISRQDVATPLYAERFAAADALSKFACLLKSQGKYDEGLAAIRRAHELVPEVARFTAEVGFHLHAAKRYDDEFPMLRRAIAQDGASPEAWLHLGLGFARRNNFAEAVPALERAHALSPDDANIRFWLGWAKQQ